MRGMRMTRAELEKFRLSLGEYSCSLPTGVVVGKKWLRNDAAFDRSAAEPERWFLGEYIEVHDLTPTVHIRWTEIDIVDLPAVEWIRAFA